MANTPEVPWHVLNIVQFLLERDITIVENVATNYYQSLVLSKIQEFIDERNHTNVKNGLRSFVLTEEVLTEELVNHLIIHMRLKATCEKCYEPFNKLSCIFLNTRLFELE